jgi:hypothetical protein
MDQAVDQPEAGAPWQRIATNRKESLTQSTEKLSLCDQALVRTDDAYVEQYILK